MLLGVRLRWWGVRVSLEGACLRCGGGWRREMNSSVRVARSTHGPLLGPATLAMPGKSSKVPSGLAGLCGSLLRGWSLRRGADVMMAVEAIRDSAGS